MSESSGLIDQIVRLVHAEWLSSWFKRSVRVWFFRCVRERQFMRAVFVKHWVNVLIVPPLALLAADRLSSNGMYYWAAGVFVSAFIYLWVNGSSYFGEVAHIRLRVDLHVRRRELSKLRREKEGL